MAKPRGMSEGPDSQMLNLLHAIGSDISRIKDDLIEIKERIGFDDDYAPLSWPEDRMAQDVKQIQMRLATAAALKREEEDPWMMSDNA
jgi:hypothetical protein